MFLWDSVGIPTEILWEWELKFHSHDNPEYPHAVAIDSNSNQIRICSRWIAFNNLLRDRRVSKPFSHSHMKHPYGIAINIDDAYVTDIVEHSVFLFESRLLSRC